MDLSQILNFVTSAFIVLLAFILLLNIFGLPANWIIVALVALWSYFSPAPLPFWFWIIFIGLAASGEVLEFSAQWFHGKRYGSSSAGGFAAMIGAFMGAILLAPLFWGIGALIGAMLGAWLGCFVMETAKGRDARQASRAALGAMLGRLLGTVLKMGAGAAMIYLVAKTIWPVS